MSRAENDRWLERLPQLRASAGSAPILELGCDTGGDTAWLVAQGFEVVGTDISERALQRCAASVPQAALLRHDLRTPLPLRDGSFGVVIASLCLHYFDWRTTVAAVDAIHRCLRADGLLLCRLNSTNDLQHGAMQGTEIEPRYFRQDAHYADFKRFFDRGDLRRLFAPDSWDELACEETTIARYAQPKVCWEQVLRRR